MLLLIISVGIIIFIEELCSYHYSFYLNITDIDIDDTELEDLLIGGKTKILIQDIDTIKWKQDLKLDKSVLVNLMTSISLIDSTRDAKLFELKKIISNSKFINLMSFYY